MVQSLPAASKNHLSARAGRRARILVWMQPRNRQTGAIEKVGFWNGDDHQVFTIDGEQRLYYGAGGLLQVDPIKSGVGTGIQTTAITGTLTAPEVEMAVRGYDLRLAEVEIHRALFDPLTHQLLDQPFRRFSGWIDGADITSPTEKDTGSLKLSLVSSARAGTHALTLKKSDESQKLRLLRSGKPDRFYQYTDVSDAVAVKWGTK